MARVMRLGIIMVVFITMLAAPQAMARLYFSGTQSSGALYEIYLPDNLNDWNGDLVVFAHGFVRPDGEPLEIPRDQLTFNGKYIANLVTGIGYAFAVTSYSKKGLAVVEGVADVVDLVTIFKDYMGVPLHVYLAGASEGGLVTTLALEQKPETFSGGLALSGPIGDFRRQLDYLCDFRIIFGYFFPGLLPSSPIDIPQEVMDNWKNYVTCVTNAISDHPAATKQLLKVTRAPTDPSDSDTRVETTLGILEYNVFATNDGKETLGGQPFDNRFRFYTGSENDFALNCKVQRFKGSVVALGEIQDQYQTSGKLSCLLVSMHNSSDHIVPYWHERFYLGKVVKNKCLRNFISIPICRYGHVNFTEGEVLAGFALLVKKVTGRELLTAARSVLKDPKSLEEFLQLGRKIGAFK